jgi:hypothetical protein
MIERSGGSLPTGDLVRANIPWDCSANSTIPGTTLRECVANWSNAQNAERRGAAVIYTPCDVQLDGWPDPVRALRAAHILELAEMLHAAQG